MRQQRPSQGVSRVELEAGAGAEGRIVQRLAVTASKSALHTSAVARCWETAGRSLCGASQHTNLPKATYRMLGWNSGQGRAAQTRSSVGEFEQAGCRVCRCRCSRVLALGTEHAPTATETEGRLSTPNTSQDLMHHDPGCTYAGIASRHLHVDLRPEGHTSCQTAPFGSGCVACIVYLSSKPARAAGR